jgi:hypothetical protein
MLNDWWSDQKLKCLHEGIENTTVKKGRRKRISIKTAGGILCDIILC